MWVMEHCVPLYLMNSRTRNFFEITIFGTRHISIARTRSYKSTPLMTLILASSATILFWSMLSDDLTLWDSLANAFMAVGPDTGVADYTNVRLYCGSWPCLVILSSGWAAVEVWLKMTSRLKGPSSETFLSVCLSKLVRQAILAFTDSKSSRK